MRDTGESMENMEQLQVVVNEVQSARQQLANWRTSFGTETTVESVKNQPEDLALHQQMGGVMVEVSDREALVNELNKLHRTPRASWKIYRKEAELMSTTTN